MEFARLEGNARPRRWLPGRRSADDLWSARSPISPADRVAFRAALARSLRSAPERPRSRSVRLQTS